jgi:hypothetical protein
MLLLLICMQINQYWVDVKTSLLNVIMLFVQAMQV